MTVVSLILVLQLSGALPPPAESSAEDPVRAAVAKWIQQLDAPALADRARAERELLDLGPKVLRWLPTKELLPGNAARVAVGRLRIKLEQRLARDSARPSRVTLSGEFTLPGVLTEITRQTGNALRFADDLPDEVRAPRNWMFANLTFWEAIDELCAQLDLTPSTSPESDALWLVARPDEEPPRLVNRVGVLRVALTDVSHHPIAGDESRRLIRLRSDLLFEPRLRPLFVHFRAGDFTATDADGNAWPAWNPAARYELPMAGASRRTRMTWDFIAPAQVDSTEFSFQGRMLVQLAAATEPIAFELPAAQEILRRRGGVSVRMFPTEFTNVEDQFRDATLKITVSYETGGPAFESHRTWVYHNAAWLAHNERRYPFTDFEALQQGDGSVQLEYRFRKLPKEGSLKFVYEAPTLLLDVPFEVEFDQFTATDGGR